MDPQTKYHLALGGFRRAVHAMADAAAGLQAAAHDLDPQGAAPDDPVALEIFGECATEMRSLVDLLPGMRQLFLAALGED